MQALIAELKKQAAIDPRNNCTRCTCWPYVRDLYYRVTCPGCNLEVPALNSHFCNNLTTSAGCRNSHTPNEGCGKVR